jgi:hypothetical protein
LNTKIKSYEEIKKKTKKKKRRKKIEIDPGNPSSPALVAAHGPVMKLEPVLPPSLISLTCGPRLSAPTPFFSSS